MILHFQFIQYNIFIHNLIIGHSHPQISGLDGGLSDEHGEYAPRGQGSTQQGCNRGGPFDDTRGTQCCG